MESVDAYKPTVIPGVVLTIGFALVGIFGNANICWATQRKSRLHSTCNLLIAITAFSDVLHQGAHVIFAYFYLSGSPFRPLSLCFRIFCVSAFNVCFGAFLVLSIGIDRLFCISFPGIYDKLNVKLYIVITMTAPTVYSAYMIKICYDEVVVNQEMLVVGMVAEIFINKANDAWHAAQAIIYLVTIIVYCLLWIVVAKKGVGKTSKKLIKSLSLIMVTLVISWLFVGAFTAVHDSIVTETTPFDTYFYHINLGVFINIGVASNYFIYFIFNEEYRRAFTEQLYIITFRPIAKGAWETTRVTSKLHTSNSINTATVH